LAIGRLTPVTRAADIVERTVRDDSETRGRTAAEDPAVPRWTPDDGDYA
jgi:hypothetical protein